MHVKYRFKRRQCRNCGDEETVVLVRSSLASREQHPGSDQRRVKSAPQYLPCDRAKGRLHKHVGLVLLSFRVEFSVCSAGSVEEY